MTDHDGSCAVLMVSCDAYQDTWDPFFRLFRKYWPDCPYSVDHLSNSAEFACKGVVPIRVGEDLSWSDNLLTGLQHIEEPYVLLMLDDLFLIHSVPTPAVRQAISWLVQTGGNHLRLNAFPKPEVRVNARIGTIVRGAAYRVSTVLTVWRREVLTSLLRTGESAWQFEIVGSIRSDTVSGFYSTLRPLIQVENTIIKRKWRRSSLRKLRLLRVSVDKEQRQVMTITQDLESQLRILANRALHLLPTGWRRILHAHGVGGSYRGANA